MPSVFTRIIDGELPARFVWRDVTCVAFLPIAPLATGHTLVVPRDEVDHWIDADEDTWAHCQRVAQRIAKAQDAVFSPVKVGIIVAGEEVPHVHIHLVPFTDMSQLDFANADHDPDPAALDDAAEAVRAQLRTAGHPEVASP